MSITATVPHSSVETWKQPSKGIVGMTCLIVAEASIFIIFIVAYVYYAGKSLSGPTPRQVLELPIFSSICLISSSVTVHFGGSALHKGKRGATSLWLALTVLLGGIFLASTAQEWYHLIYHDGLTIQTNLFGTTFYSLVGLHASHVIVGLIMLSLALTFSLTGQMTTKHSEKLEVLSLYWHFVDAVWIVVFLVVYVLCV